MIRETAIVEDKVHTPRLRRQRLKSANHELLQTRGRHEVSEATLPPSDRSSGIVTNDWKIPTRNATAQACPGRKSVSQLVATQALAKPDAMAVAAGGQVMNYRELDARSNQLARHLRSLGVGSGSLVALSLRRSPAFVVGALGILKAGGAYLPLDPSLPDARLASLLDDARVRILVTGQCIAERMPANTHSLVILDGVGRLNDPPSAEPLSVDTELSDLAYVIYTSGSTGHPKGVEITHDSLSNLISWHQETFAVTSADRASQLACIGFDAAVWELWPYLTAGASLHVPEQTCLNDPESLRDWLVAQRITISFVPTPLAERLMVLNWPEKTALRIMLTGGDTLHLFPAPSLPFRLVNNYGPTECTVVTTSGVIFPYKYPDRLPPIGRAIANTQLYVLNRSLEEVPIGTPGELHVGGTGLARGYRNRPDLTAKKFIPNPFSAEPGARLYKTGDLVQFMPDGQLAFLGRIDEQIKVRGFRIEPNEIIRVLNGHPAVLQSTIVAREIAPGDVQLVAYYVPAPQSHSGFTELRNFLAARLPEYMVPSLFVALEALPLNANGKVDRTALPVPGSENTLRDDSFAAPRTHLEERVAGILAPLLGMDRVSLNDNFFLLGGHSLLGTQLIARVRDAFRVELTLRDIFEAPRVAQLSAEIERLLLSKLESMSEDEAQHLLSATAQT